MTSFPFEWRVNVDIDGDGDQPKRTLYIGHNGRGAWCVDIRGGDFKPAFISTDPVWYESRKWSKIPDMYGIDETFWNGIRGEVRDAYEAETGEGEGAQEPEVSEEIKQKAVDLLQSGRLIDSIIDATNRHMKGGEDLRRLAVASGVSTYMDGAKLHLSAVGEPQTGKTAHTDAVMNHLPEEDVIPLSEVSPQAFYYMSKKMDFDKKIVRIDDAREAQIPVIKVLEDDSPTPAKKYTVIDGEGVELGIQGRPVLWTTSVGPLVDRSGQTVSRSLMISPDGVTDEEASEIKRKIWEREQFGGARKPKHDETRQIHQTAFRMLRGPGAGDVIIPFTVDPPKNCSNRGTNQFITLIRSLAFINQFRRVRFHGDGKRYILANFDDLREAARLWFAFFDLQTHKSGGKWVRDILVCLETSPPDPDLGRLDARCRTPKEISELSGLSTRTVNNYLTDLYEAGIVDRANVKGPGNPFAYWISAKYAFPKESISSDAGTDLGKLGKSVDFLNYLKANQIQEPSISIIFNQLGKDIEEWKKEKVNGIDLEVENSSREIILSSYLENAFLNTSEVAGDSDYLGKSAFFLNNPDSPNESTDSDESGKGSGEDIFLNPSGTDGTEGTVATVGTGETPKDDHGGEELAGEIPEPSERDRPKKEGERSPPKKIDPPEEDRLPTAEEAEALEVARSLQAAGKRVTFGNVETHLNKAEGYVETSRVWGLLRALGALGWTTGKDGVLSPPTSEEVVL